MFIAVESCSSFCMGVPCPAKVKESSFNEGENPAHLNSRYMRELTHGNFIIKQDQIALLDHIGQGTYLTQITVVAYLCWENFGVRNIFTFASAYITLHYSKLPQFCQYKELLSCFSYHSRKSIHTIILYYS